MIAASSSPNHSHTMATALSESTVVHSIDIVPTEKYSKMTLSPPAAILGDQNDQAPKGCNRCKNCPGYSAHDCSWRRNTCTNCKCARSLHSNMLVGSNCCAMDRVGFDPLLSFGNKNENGTAGTSSNCRIRALAEDMGYTWVPLVSNFYELWLNR